VASAASAWSQRARSCFLQRHQVAGLIDPGQPARVLKEQMSAVARDRRQPRAGPPRDACPGPAPHGLGKRLLRTVLGQIPVTGPPDERRDDPAPLLGEGRLDRPFGLVAHPSRNGRTSIVPSLTGASW
jgi:hypothetical protein